MGDVHSVDRGGADKNSKPEMKKEGDGTSGSLGKSSEVEGRMCGPTRASMAREVVGEAGGAL